jgi:hypothetical protein
METKVINIDGLGVQGVQNLIDKNPSWGLISCGSSEIDMKINGIPKVVNFAVFELKEYNERIEEYPSFKQ